MGSSLHLVNSHPPLGAWSASSTKQNRRELRMECSCVAVVVRMSIRSAREGNFERSLIGGGGSQPRLSGRQL